MSIFNLIGEKLQWLGKQQQVVADNLQRSSLKNAKAQKLENFKFKERVSKKGHLKHSGTLKTTKGNHLMGTNRGNLERVKEVPSKKTETNLYGNSINPEKQLAELNESLTETQKMHKIYGHYIRRYHKSLDIGSK